MASKLNDDADEWPPPEIPELPEVISQAANEANLVIFIGAGVSRLMGCPSWDQLADKILRDIAREEIISFGDIQQLIQDDLDSRKKLSIAMNLAKLNRLVIDFEKHIEPERPKDSRIYEYLKGIGCVYVTTNYDRFLDTNKNNPAIASTNTYRNSSVANRPTNKIIKQPDQLAGLSLYEPGTVIHLHGSIDKSKNMIITTADYIRHYNRDNVKNFLYELFNNHTVLFVGYGLEEWEILEYILSKSTGSEEQSRINKEHYMLVGFYSHQEKTKTHLNNYYYQYFNVNVIPYNLDKMEYKQLEKIFEVWSGQIDIGEILLSDEYQYVMGAVDE